jgi:hypothetical protein
MRGIPRPWHTWDVRFPSGMPNARHPPPLAPPCDRVQGTPYAMVAIRSALRSC